MKKTNLFVIILSLLATTAWAGETVQLGWDPPTNRVLNNDCDQVGDPLTPAEVANLQYILSYRIKDSGAVWTNVETIEPTATLDLSYSTTYEASVGAHWPGGEVLCATELVEFTTGVGPAPGPCSAFGRR